MHRRALFVPNRTVATVGIIAFGMLLGTSVRAEILKCVNDAGQIAFANTGACPEGYRPSEASPETSTSRPPVVTTGRRPPPAAAPDPRTPTPTDSGEKVPTIWEIGFGDPAAEEWLRKKLTDKSKWTAEGRGSTPEKVWNRMKAALLRGDVEGALRCFSPITRDLYRETFQALGTDARVMAQQMKELIPREKNDFAAEYWLPRDTEVGGRMQPLVFSVSFIRGGDGVWLIERF